MKKLDYQRLASWINQEYKKSLDQYWPSQELVKKQYQQQARWATRPKISLLVPVFRPKPKVLIECIESVISQSYPNWEICMADDASNTVEVKNIIRKYASRDGRIKYLVQKNVSGISENTNAAFRLAGGEFAGFLDDDDILWPNALFECVKAINLNPKIEFIYSDEDKLEEDGVTHVDPFFKPDWNFDYLRTTNYIIHLVVIKRGLFDRIGGLRTHYDGSQDWDLCLRATRMLGNNSIFHVSKILYSWRKSKTSNSSEKKKKSFDDPAHAIQKYVLVDDLEQRGKIGEVTKTQFIGNWRIRYGGKYEPNKVTIIRGQKLSDINQAEEQLLFVDPKCKRVDPQAVEAMWEYSQQKEIGIVSGKLGEIDDWEEDPGELYPEQFSWFVNSTMRTMNSNNPINFMIKKNLYLKYLKVKSKLSLGEYLHSLGYRQVWTPEAWFGYKSITPILARKALVTEGEYSMVRDVGAYLKLMVGDKAADFWWRPETMEWCLKMFEN